MSTEITYRDYLAEENLPHFWCPGCGYGVIVRGIATSLAELKLPKNKVVVVSGIGCWGKADDYLSTNTMHGTHGRALAFATGIKAARPELTVIAIMGDGDTANIGGNHFIHAARRNLDITAIVANNYCYGMTGGQFSATTPAGKRSSTTVAGNAECGFDLCRLADVAGANYVARTTVYHVRQIPQMITEAISKPGFSMVEVLSTCPTFYGRLNGMASPIEMLKWIREYCVTIEKFEEMTAEERAGRLAIGRFIDQGRPDFMTEYVRLNGNDQIAWESLLA